MSTLEPLKRSTAQPVIQVNGAVWTSSSSSFTTSESSRYVFSKNIWIETLVDFFGPDHFKNQFATDGGNLLTVIHGSTGVVLTTTKLEKRRTMGRGVELIGNNIIIR